MKNKLKELIEFGGYSYKKEMIKLLVINTVALIGVVVLLLLLKSWIWSLISLFVTILLDYFLLNRYKDKKRDILIARENELVTIISYFEIYIHNHNNVYQSFSNLIPFCSDWMKDKIEQFLRAIDEDKTVQPFIDFANNFQQLSAHSLLLSIYQMVDQGENSKQLIQFNVIFDNLSKTRNQEIIQKKEKALSNMATYPLIGAGIITVTLTISILSVLGDLINVI